jgi:DNA-binding transcriptional LysR family regulator
VELRRLRYFIAVAEHMNFSRAALQLHIAEPPLNRQVRQLEEELGVELFVRDHHLLDLTDAGRVLLREAKALIAQTAHALEAVEKVKAGQAGVVRVGLAVGLGETATRVLLAHAKPFPAVEVQCKDIFSTLQIKELVERRIDVGFLRPPVDNGDLVSEVCYEERLLVVLSATSPLAKQKSVKMKDIVDLPLLMHERSIGVGVYDKVVDLFRNANITPNIAALSTRPDGEAVLARVASRQAYAIRMAPRWSPVDYGSRLVVLPLNEPGAWIELRMAWRRDERSTAVLAFLDTARKELKRIRQQNHREAA